MSEQDNSLRTEEASESGLLLSVEPTGDKKYYAKPGDDSDSDTDLSDVVGGDEDDEEMGDGSDGDTSDGTDGDSSGDDGGILSDSDSSDSDSDGGDATTL
jgi:hypothetical protein